MLVVLTHVACFSVPTMPAAVTAEATTDLADKQQQEQEPKKHFSKSKLLLPHRPRVSID